ncbi:putative transketolase [Phialemonium atrogriseum]|uniref:RNA polymerase II holoenzyme cyclin-like subunit n=1 Tax=Phialemonium atrogriseum TaxID=1093897 RepID=A0AAJ0CCH0_9PEZI|nr:putative transketolase [Phialemonium atrogriseum]KAK1772938.1 putative transketolase [Phialemonium atrogriseum]
MAANYWESSQRKHWQFTKDQLTSMRQNLEAEDASLVQMFPLPQLRHLYIYFNQQINRLGKRLGVRQQAMATAQIYMKRFYTKVEIRRTNPYLVISTAVYLACKMEECPQHIRLVVSEARSLWPADFIGLDTSKLGECEFFLISEMNSQLIVHQPYRTLTTLQSEFSLTQDEFALAWSAINDHYMTDLPLLYPPHIGAAGGDKKAGDARIGKVARFAGWLAESSIDIEVMVDSTQELISFYECHEQYNDKLTREQINRYVKARGLDK